MDVENINCNNIGTTKLYLTKNVESPEIRLKLSSEQDVWHHLFFQILLDKAQSATSNAITFQEFVNVVSVNSKCLISNC